MPSPFGQLALEAVEVDLVVEVLVVIVLVLVDEVTGTVFPLRDDLTALINGYLPFYLKEQFELY